MFLSPKLAVDQQWITHPDEYLDWEKYLSPNAIDFTADRLFEINQITPFFISEESKQMRKQTEVLPLHHADRDCEYWELQPGVYDAMSDFHVTLPKGVAALLIIRSTFNRNGLFLTSGLYDQGFVGSIGVALHNRSGVAYIAPHTRIGQIMFIKSDGLDKLYAGQYNTAQGEHWTENV